MIRPLSRVGGISAARRSVAEAVRAGIARPPRTMREFAEQEIYIPTGPHKGKRFRVDRQPVARLWFDAIDSGRWSEFVFTAPSQVGKSLTGFVIPALYHACELRENYVLGLPHGDMGANKWEADLAPAIEASPTLRHHMPERGIGAQGGRVRDSITLRYGQIIKLMTAGADDSGKAGFTARSLGLTEAARFSAAGETSVEADPLRQLRARQRSFSELQRRTYIEGTLTTEDELPWALWALSTRSRIVAPCPHCREFVEPWDDDLLGFEEARSDLEARELAFWCCPSCGQAISEEERRDSVAECRLIHGGEEIDRNGKVTGEAVRSLRLWYHVKPYFNMFLSAADIAADVWRSQQIPEDSPQRESADRELAMFVWAKPHRPPSLSTDFDLDAKTVEKRREEYPRGVVPPDTHTLTIGSDIGEKICWYVVLAHRADGRRHVVDYGAVDVPQDVETDEGIRQALAEIQRVTDAGYRGDGPDPWRSHQTWFDCGSHPDAVLEHVRACSRLNRRSAVVGSYGRGQSAMVRSNYAAPKKTGNEVREVDPAGLWYMVKVKRAKTHAIYWHTDRSKHQAQRALAVSPETPGSITLFAGTGKTHERFSRHVVNERLVTVAHPIRGTKQVWRKTGANHLLDCLAAALRAYDRVEWMRENGHEPEPHDGEVTVGKAKAPRRGWYGDETPAAPTNGAAGRAEKPKRSGGWYE